MPGDYSMSGPITALVGDKQYTCLPGSKAWQYARDLSKTRIDFSSMVRKTPDKTDDSSYVNAAKDFYKDRAEFVKKFDRLPESDTELQDFLGIKLTTGKTLLEERFNKVGLLRPAEEKTEMAANPATPSNEQN